MPSPPSPRILIYGYYGFDNAGDEAILAATLAELRRLWSEVTPVVTSGNPSETTALHGVTSIRWRDLGRLLDEARRSDLILMAGGGLFHDYWGCEPLTMLSPEQRGIPFFASSALLAGLVGTPLAVIGVGVGPLLSEAARDLTRLVFEQASLATVRDQYSFDQVRELGLSAGQVEATADLAHLLELDGWERGKRILKGAGVEMDGGPILGVALREWDIGVEPAHWETLVAEALDEQIVRHGARVVFVPFQALEEYLSDDRIVAERVRGRMRHGERCVLLHRELMPSESAAVLACCQAVLGMRLHSVILALRGGVPTIALSYDPKVRATMEQLGLGDWVLDIESFSSSKVATLLDEGLETGVRFRDQVAPQLEQARLVARRSFEKVERLLARPPSGVRPSLQPEMLELLQTIAFARGRAALSRNGEPVGDKPVLDGGTEASNRASAEVSELVLELSFAVAELRREGERLRSKSLRLRQQLEELDADRVRVHDLLQRISTSRAFLVASWIWRIHAALREYRFPGRSHLVRLLKGLGARWSRVLRKWKPMTYYAYAFDRFKRRRRELYPPDLQGTRCPSEPGLVSIVLPVYNGEDLVEEALESILAQTYVNFELIAINDGSTDSTGEILEEYARRDERIRVIHQDNRKIPRTLSRGFRLARGELLTWTSADNRLKPEFLERMVACLDENPSWDMVYGNVDLIGDDGEPLRGSPWYYEYQNPTGSEHIHLPRDTSELNTWPNNYVGAAFLYRDRVAWLLGDYSPHRFTIEDYDYWMRVNALLTLRHTPFSEPLYEYRFHDQSLTARDEELGITRSRESLMIFEEFRRDFCLTPLIWFLDAEDGGQPTARIEAALQRRISGAGHRVQLGDPDDAPRMPRLWCPAVVVRLVERAEDAGGPSTEGVPATALKVLVVTGEEPLPGKVDSRWDLCVAVRADGEPGPRLPGSYRGWLTAPDADTLFTVIDVRARSDALARLEEESAAERDRTARPIGQRATDEPGVELSVILCTYKRNERLSRAVASVARQTLPAERYEVLVVDNNPADQALREQIECLREEHFTDRPDRFRRVLCPTVGLSHARNAGISEARGEVLCFLDDDAIARESCLEEVLRAFRKHPEAGVVGGHIVLLTPQPRPKVVSDGWERYWSQFVTGHQDSLPVKYWWEYPWGANWSARRQALLEIGGFRSSYGRSGNDFSGGEEIIAASLIARLGYEIVIAPAAEVLHDVEPSRYSFHHVRRTIIAGNLVNYQAQRDLYLPMESSPGQTFRYLLNPKVDRTVSANDRLTRIRHWLYRREAWVRLLSRQLTDVLCRYRQPIGRRAD